MTTFTDEKNHTFDNGWALEVTGFRALHEEDENYMTDFGCQGFLAAGYLVKGDRRIRATGFAGRTLRAAVASLVESAKADADHLEKRGW